ncbi:hypothetical protein CCACVL1_00143 [Corchorus capsularis]|uniref:Uncharacterized protein n=1 Tax=Corchorus capsularis TaxID=210143 RepID=A0A1R3KY88_COCAP|nr:hypothetical protein CCACVL1_00143 [Corchorus capsularis]
MKPAALLMVKKKIFFLPQLNLSRDDPTLHSIVNF